MSLPRWIAVKGNAHGGVVHQADDGFWRANNWQGCLGGFATESEAELAILTAPPKPKRKRAPKPEAPEWMRWQGLTDNGSGYPVIDAERRRVGAVIRIEADRFAAWTKREKLGEFPTADGAERTVRNAVRAEKKA